MQASTRTSLTSLESKLMVKMPTSSCTAMSSRKALTASRRRITVSHMSCASPRACTVFLVCKKPPPLCRSFFCMQSCQTQQLPWLSIPSLSTKGWCRRKLSLSSSYSCQTDSRITKTSKLPQSSLRMPAHIRILRYQSQSLLPSSSQSVACSFTASTDALTTRWVPTLDHRATLPPITTCPMYDVNHCPAAIWQADSRHSFTWLELLRCCASCYNHAHPSQCHIMYAVLVHLRCNYHAVTMQSIRDM